MQTFDCSASLVEHAKGLFPSCACCVRQPGRSRGVDREKVATAREEVPKTGMDKTDKTLISHQAFISIYGIILPIDIYFSR